MRVSSHFQPAPVIYVRNNGAETFSDRYDGEDFAIKPGEYIAMPVEAATLCLGYGDASKNRAIARLGWAPKAEQFKDAVARLNKFSFHGSEEEAAGKRKGQSHAPLVPAAPSKPSGEAGEDGQEGNTNLIGKLARAQAQAPA